MAKHEFLDIITLPGEKRGTIANKRTDEQLPAGSRKVTSTISPKGIGQTSDYKRIITYGETPAQNDTIYMYQSKINPFAQQYFAPIEKKQNVKQKSPIQPVKTNSDPVYYTEAEKLGGTINYLNLFK